MALVIKELIRSANLPLDELAKTFDSATHQERVDALSQLNPRAQAHLFDAAQGRKRVLNDMVPAERPPLREVICEGKNTLPVFRSFQKRFCRPSPAHETAHRKVVWGYNHQPFSWATGPGYFIAYEDSTTDEVVIDYRELPPEAPEHWPTVVRNEARLGRFVYQGMVDRVRRVSEYVSVGRAYKGKPMDAWFVLVRAP